MTSLLQILAEDGSLRRSAPDLTHDRLRELFVHMLRIRCLDERMLKLQRAGRVGFVGTATGQEAATVGATSALEERDWCWSGLREGGAALMRGMPLSEYVAQMYCNANDTAKGRQMCNHFQHKGSHYPSWSSVIGTQLPHAVGAAWAGRARGLDEVHAVFFGDGATSSNGFHSSMNLAAVWKAPVVFLCVDNGWAISVPAARQSAAGSLADKGLAYGVPGVEVDGNDVLACHMATRDALARARDGGGPSLLVQRTSRMLGHSSSDAPTRDRAAAEGSAWAARDPIARFERYLCDCSVLPEGSRAELEAELLAQIDRTISEQEAALPMALRTLVEDVYAEVPAHLKLQYNRFHDIAQRLGEARQGDGAFPL
jgi:TPP-dependent pyruvate/acetoin dehydrogenase alpha subunit